MINQFKNPSCYEEFEIKCALIGISKVYILKEIGHKIDDYYFFVSEDGVFNWFDLNGNHVKDPDILNELKSKYIPSAIIKCIIPTSVTSIGFEAFFGCESLTSITIPDNVTHIGIRAFCYCKSLTIITIPNSVTSIGYAAFSHCKSLTSITIPNSVTYIGNGAFYGCESLKEIIIPNSVTSIGFDTFFRCGSLTSITIPNSVTSIGNYAFYLCDSLKEVIFKGKTLEEIKQMKNYPFGIEDENVFKFS